MSKGVIPYNPVGSTRAVLKNIDANIVAVGSVASIHLEAPKLNPGLQKLVAACINEISEGHVYDSFIEQLAHFNRSVSDRNLSTKFVEAGCPEIYYDFAIEAKESFAKFFEITARHKSGQIILVSAFKHAYSVFREKIQPIMGSLSFSEQSAIFENDVVEYLSQNLTGLPEFYGRMEALGLLYYMADNCFIEYAKCSA